MAKKLDEVPEAGQKVAQIEEAPLVRTADPGYIDWLFG